MQTEQVTIDIFPTVKVNDYNVMINRQNFSDQPVRMIKEHMITFKRL